MAKTRWRIVQDDGTELGILESPDGRTFAPGDWVNIPPPPKGTVWTVLAVEDLPDYDGRLIVGDPRDRLSLESTEQS